MFDTDTDIRRIPDDPRRVAPPHCAPGEIEPPAPREPGTAQVRALTAEVEMDVLACLKGERNFMGYSNDGHLSAWTPYELWAVLTNDMKENEIAHTLAAVLDFRSWCEDYAMLSFKWHLEREILDPFVAEQVKWRVELACDENDEAMGEWA